MKYCLVVNLNNEYYEIQGFSKIPGFDHLDETKIKDIVSFTNEFETEQEMICYLIETGLLPNKFFKGNLGINYYKSKNAKPKILQHGVSFKEDRKFFDTTFLQYYFAGKLNDLNFMESFITRFYSYLKDVGVFSEDLRFINYSYNCILNNNSVPSYADEAMINFVRIYCRKKGKDGYFKADFTRIRDLAMFAIQYERDFIRVPIERPEHTVEELETLINHYQRLIDGGNLDEEQIAAYTTTLDKANKELEFTKQTTLIRRKKNEVTGN